MPFQTIPFFVFVIIEALDLVAGGAVFFLFLFAFPDIFAALEPMRAAPFLIPALSYKGKIRSSPAPARMPALSFAWRAITRWMCSVFSANDRIAAARLGSIALVPAIPTQVAAKLPDALLLIKRQPAAADQLVAVLFMKSKIIQQIGIQLFFFLPQPLLRILQAFMRFVAHVPADLRISRPQKCARRILFL